MNLDDSQKPPRQRTRVISDIGMLDLLYVTSPEDLADVKEIRDIGMLLIHRSMQRALAGIEVSDVGAIVPIPDGEKMNMLSGQTTITGEALAAGASDSILVVAGQLFVTSPTVSVGYKEIQVYGQIFATRGSESAILPKITHLSGQNFFIPENPRFLKGETFLNEEFFTLLPEPQPLVVMGHLKLAVDVTRESLKSKVPEIVLMGNLEAPAHLIPLLEVLTREKMGTISAYL